MFASNGSLRLFISLLAVAKGYLFKETSIKPQPGALYFSVTTTRLISFKYNFHP